MANIKQIRRKMNYNAHPEFEKRPEQLIRAQAAKIIECPRNVIELRKLLNTWDDIDRAKKRVLSKLSSERYMLKLKYRELLTGETSGSIDETLLLPPGFRYHANGEPKKTYKGRGCSKPKLSESRSYISSSDIYKDSSPEVEIGKSEIDNEIIATVKAIQETDTDRKLHAINRKLTKVKSNLNSLRAKSSENVAKQSSHHSPPTRRTGRLSAKQCEACFTRLKWSEHKMKPSRGPKDTLGRKPWSSSTRITPNTTPPATASTGRSSTCSMTMGSPSPSRMTPRKDIPIAWGEDSPSQKTSLCKAESTSFNFNKSGGDSRHSVKEERAKTVHPPYKSGSVHSKLLQTVTKANLGLQTQSVPTVNVGAQSIKTAQSSNNSKSKDVFDISSSSEDCYRWVMRRSGISDQKKLETMSDMFEKAGLIGTKKEGPGPQKQSQCHIQVTHRSVPHLGKTDVVQARHYTRALAARRNRLELETKCSNSKVEEFLRRLPTPDVTIRRWRTSSGDVQVIKRCANPTPPGDGQAEEPPPDEGTTRGVEGAEVSVNADRVKCDEGRDSHSSDSDGDGQDSSDSESLAINTSLTCWPTHWAQRAAFLNRNQDNEDSDEQDKGTDPVKEFKKLAHCRYLRIPPRML